MDFLALGRMARERFGRFFAWWGGLFGLAATAGSCPCCGSPSCPNGLLANGIIAGVAAFLIQWWRRTKQ